MEKILYETLELEKKLQLSDILARNRTGIPIYDFYRLLSSYGIRLHENDKILLNASFKHKQKQDFFNAELLYLQLERMADEALSGSVGSGANIEGTNIEFWEAATLRKVA